MTTTVFWLIWVYHAIITIACFIGCIVWLARIKNLNIQFIFLFFFGCFWQLLFYFFILSENGQTLEIIKFNKEPVVPKELRKEIFELQKKYPHYQINFQTK
jgi:hypothetical protein